MSNSPGVRLLGRHCCPLNRSRIRFLGVRPAVVDLCLVATGIMQLMKTPQSGIFALGTSSHAYIEFDLTTSGDAHALVVALANLREPRTTVGGINLVSGFRPELWRELMPDDLPAELAGFTQ